MCAHLRASEHAHTTSYYTSILPVCKWSYMFRFIDVHMFIVMYDYIHIFIYMFMFISCCTMPSNEQQQKTKHVKRIRESRTLQISHMFPTIPFQGTR